MMKNIGSGKVIDSGPNDHVFVFFSDHGAPGLIAFPSDRVRVQHLMYRPIDAICLKFVMYVLHVFTIFTADFTFVHRGSDLSLAHYVWVFLYIFKCETMSDKVAHYLVNFYDCNVKDSKLLQLKKEILDLGFRWTLLSQCLPRAKWRLNLCAIH